MKRSHKIAMLVLVALTMTLGAGVEADPSATGGWLAPDSATGRSETYRAGQRALDAKRWDEAADLFGALAAEGGPEADAAYYWSAYALIRSGRNGDAMSALAQLQSRYPNSSWIDDAKALELEAGGADNPRVRAQSAEDEELKLYALNSLMHTDSDKAVQVLADFLRKESSLELKEKALFILSQNDSPQAREILASVARGQQHPELALQAVEMLGFYDDQEGRRVLKEIYDGTNDHRVKAKVIEALMISEDGTRLYEIAKSENDPELRRKAVEMLGVMEATSQLSDLYETETDVQVKAKILEAFFIADDADTLLDAALTETEPRLRLKAIEGLGLIGNSQAREALRSLYDAGGDTAERAKILEAFFLSDDADALLEILATEEDPALRRKAIESLGLIGDSRSSEALRSLYGKTTDRGERAQIIESYFLADDTEALMAVIAEEVDGQLRGKAIESLGLVGEARSGELLRELYGNTTDRGEKVEILEAFFIQDNYRDLIEVVKTEEDRELKKRALEYLSLMDSDEATDFVLGLLED